MIKELSHRPLPNLHQKRNKPSNFCRGEQTIRALWCDVGERRLVALLLRVRHPGDFKFPVARLAVPARAMIRKSLLLFSVVCHAVISAVAQGTFQNLDFEQANVPMVPAGQHGADVLVSQGLPGWTAYTYSSTSPVTMVLHNNQSLGAPAVALLGPDWNSGGILQGQYSILLQPSFPDLLVDPAVAQTGTIPADAQSMRYISKLFFKTAGVSFAGQTLPVSILGGSLAEGYIFGANVSTIAGQTGELRFYGGGYLDRIEFSAQPIPEPGTITLFTFGALLPGWRFLRKTR